MTVNVENESRVVRRVTWTGLVVNVALSVLKILGGWLGRSQVVVADGVHSLSDLTTDLAILVGVHYWGRPADAGHPHGHRRIETMITLAIGLVLCVVATALLWSAVAGLARGAHPTPGVVALIPAVISVVVKEWLYRYTASRGRRVRSMPLIANAWHHRTDAMSSIPAAMAVGLALMDPRWAFLDEVGTVAVSLFIYHAALGIVGPSFRKLIDSAADASTLAKIKSVARDTDGVQGVHGVRTRFVGCASLSVDLHVEVAPDMTVRDGHDISETVKKRLLAGVSDIVDVVVHLEPLGERDA